MATGPPKGTIPYMTPFPTAADPPSPQPIPDVLHPKMTLAERGSARFSLSGKHAIGKYAKELPGKILEH